MKKLLAALLILTCLLSLLAGCGTGEDSDAVQVPEDEVATAPDEAPEQTGGLIEYTVGNVTIFVPASYQTQDYSQTVQGIDIHMLYISNGAQMGAVSSTSYATGSGFLADDEQSLDTTVDGIVSDLAGQGGKPKITRQSETAYVKFGGDIWAHRNLVVKAGGEYAEIDIYINHVPDEQNAVIFMTAGSDKHISGSNEAIVQTILGSLVLGADEQAPNDESEHGAEDGSAGSEDEQDA